MLGDRVKIGTSGAFQESAQDMFHVYMPRRESIGGPFIQAADGTVLVESVGGVKVGTTGTIAGEAIRVHRANLKNQSGVPGLGMQDFVLVYPIALDQYQQVGWFPADDIRIMSGGRA
jgi:hypothetical protein